MTLAKFQKTQYIRSATTLDYVMKRLKDETLSIRTSLDIKRRLSVAAEREHRSIASMMEV